MFRSLCVVSYIAVPRDRLWRGLQAPRLAAVRGGETAVESVCLTRRLQQREDHAHCGAWRVFAMLVVMDTTS